MLNLQHFKSHFGIASIFAQVHILNPIPTGLCHMITVYGLIQPIQHIAGEINFSNYLN